MSPVAQRQLFLHTIGTAQFYILEVKNSYLSSVTVPRLLSFDNAIRQNRILQVVYAVYNCLCSMSKRVGIRVPPLLPVYVFKAPIPIPNRPCLIHTISLNSVQILHQLRDNYLHHIRPLKPSIFLKRVQLYMYLLRKCITILKLIVD